MSNARENDDCYAYPQYWDLAFRSETKLEADFFEAVAHKYAAFPVRKLYEPGCGGGRLIVEMAARGFQPTGVDLSRPAVDYVRRRLRRRGLSGEVQCADMTFFQPRPPQDMAFCTFNTFRHLTSESAARRHLETISASLRPGGIYVLGLHLLPLDADPECQERWSARHGRTKVTVTLRVLDFDRRRRREVIRFNLLVRSGDTTHRIAADYHYRIYTASQMKRLLAAVPSLEICDVYDFWYEIDNPLKLNDDITDTVFVLRKRE